MKNRPPWGAAPTAELGRRDGRRQIMSVKIRVSYTDEEELAGVIRLLSPVVKSWKVKPQKGRYKLAYIDMKSGVIYPVLVTENAGKPAENKEK